MAREGSAKYTEQQVLRAATQLCMLLLMESTTKSDAKLEHIHTKIITLLFPAYRSHGEPLFQLGVFKRSPGLT